MTTETIEQEAVQLTLKEMRDYFKGLGFTNLAFASGTDQSECWTNMDGINVLLNPRKQEVELTVISGLIKSTTGPLGFPNKNLPVFIKQISQHALDW